MKKGVSKIGIFVALALASSIGLAQGVVAPQKYELSFQFDQSGTPAFHIFVLKWPSADASLASIEVLDAETKTTLQTIAIPSDGLHLNYNDVVNAAAETKNKKPTTADKIVDAVDYNFDSFPDLRLIKKWPYQPGDKGYLIYLFDQKSKNYKLSADLSALPAPTPNPKTHQIESTTLDGSAGSAFTTRIYTIDPSGKLRVEAKITQKLLDEKKLTFSREVRLRIKGQLQRVCTATVLAEGKATKISGRRQVCLKYLRKK